MAKFCRSCGAALEDGAERCSACGAGTQREEIAPAAKKQTPEALKKASDVINTIFMVVEKVIYLAASKLSNVDAKKASSNGSLVRQIVLGVMIALCLTTAILNLFGTYDVTMNASVAYGSEKQEISEAGPISDLYEADEFVDVMIVNILYGVGNVLLIGFAVILILQTLKPAGKDKLYTLYTVAGLGVNVIYMILFAICGSGSQDLFITEMKYSLEVHFITWINVLLFALLFALALAKVSTAKKPAVEAAETTVE